ncbi:MAG: hypothetical protein ACYTGP_13105, partial [Planctomycetota bacterium]
MNSIHRTLAAMLAALTVVALTDRDATARPTDPPPTVVYDALGADDGVAFFGDLVLDDVVLDGGGLVQTLTIALTADGGGGPSVVTDCFVRLALDGGDGIPDLDGTGDDLFIIETAVFGLSVAAGGRTEVVFDVSGSFPMVPPGALLFGGVQPTNPLVAHLFTALPTVGSTSDVVFSFAGMGPVPAPGVTNPELTNSRALAFHLDAIPLPGASTRSGIVGTPITFDGLTEGLQGTSVSLGGVTFSEGRDGDVPPIDKQFAADDAVAVEVRMTDRSGGTGAPRRDDRQHVGEVHRAVGV